jgi:hypothetical protein
VIHGLIFLKEEEKEEEGDNKDGIENSYVSDNNTILFHEK